MVKKTGFHFTIQPHAREALEKQAAKERRSMANMLERMILEYVEKQRP